MNPAGTGCELPGGALKLANSHGEPANNALKFANIAAHLPEIARKRGV